MLCQPLWWLVLSLFLIVFFFWCYFPKILDFPFQGVLRELTSNLSSFKASKPYLFRLSFWLSFFLSFFPSELNSFLPSWKFSQLLPFMVLLSGFLEVPSSCSWIVTLQAIGSFLHHWVIEKDISFLHFLCFLVHFLSCLNLILAVLHDLRILNPWHPLGTPAQFFPLDSLWFSNLDRLSFFLSSLRFMGSKACPFVGSRL